MTNKKVRIDGEEYFQTEADILLKFGELIESCGDEQCFDHYHKWEGVLNADLLFTLSEMKEKPCA